MKKFREQSNVGVAHGQWGEDVAVAQLRIEGLVVLDRNVRPCRADRRIELDIIAYDRTLDVLVFVEVKQHRARSLYQRRLRSINRHKLELLRRGCRAWMLANRWQGAYRFDVIEVYGEPDGVLRPEVDHIKHVRLFRNVSEFVNWEE